MGTKWGQREGRGRREISLRMEKGDRRAKCIISFNRQNHPTVILTLQLRKGRPGKVKCHIQGHRARLILALPGSEVDAFPAKLGCVSLTQWVCTHSEPGCVEFWSYHLLIMWPWVSYLILGFGCITDKMGVIHKRTASGGGCEHEMIPSR